jgi:putative colanic acid biosynthesis acetyltransferase WcaB
MSNPFSFIFQDWTANERNGKGRLVLAMFRMAQWLTALPQPVRVLGVPYFVFYRVLVEWVLGIELRRTTRVGSGLALYHGQGLVVNDHTVIGSNCTLRHNTTIGHKSRGGTDCPRIGNNVDIGPNCVILGAITVGDNAVIGAGSVVVKDVLGNVVVAGNPAVVIREGVGDGL